MNEQKSTPVIAIVGAGASGVTCTVQLIIKWKISGSGNPLTIQLFDKMDFGPGLAYGTGEDGHLLNTRANLMGIMPGEPNHFVEWMQQEASSIEKEYPGLDAGPDSYPPRTLFGKYLREMLNHYVDIAAENGIKVSLIKNDITDAELSSDNNWKLISNEDRTWSADYMILATGNPQPSSFEELEGLPGYLSSPWPSSKLLETVSDKNASVGVIGSSLTALDCVISLVENGHKGPVHFFSLNGLLPRVQFPKEKPFDRKELTLEAIRKLMRTENRAPRIKDLIRLFRKEVDAVDKTIDWSHQDRSKESPAILLKEDLERARNRDSIFQQVLYSLRYDSYEIWKLLEPDQKKLYGKWIKSFIDINRHSIPLKNGEKLLRLLESGQVEVMGDSDGVEPGNEGFILKNKKGESWKAHYLVNASGPAVNVEKMDDLPLLQNLLKKDLVEAYPAGGLQADLRTMLLTSKAGDKQPNLYAVGHPLAGMQLDVNALWFNVEQVDLLTNDLVSRIS